MELTGAGKDMRKLMKKLEKNGAYDDSDDEKNPYASSVGVLSSDPQMVVERHCLERYSGRTFYGLGGMRLEVTWRGSGRRDQNYCLSCLPRCFAMARLLAEVGPRMGSLATRKLQCLEEVCHVANLRGKPRKGSSCNHQQSKACSRKQALRYLVFRCSTSAHSHHLLAGHFHAHLQSYDGRTGSTAQVSCRTRSFVA